MCAANKYSEVIACRSHQVLSRHCQVAPGCEPLVQHHIKDLNWCAIAMAIISWTTNFPGKKNITICNSRHCHLAFGPLSTYNKINAPLAHDRNTLSTALAGTHCGFEFPTGRWLGVASAHDWHHKTGVCRASLLRCPLLMYLSSNCILGGTGGLHTPSPPRED